jgi:hypothetical protein
LLRERFFKGARVAKLGAEHKKELVRVLGSALAENFDFSGLIDPDLNPDNCFALPDTWVIKDPRSLFEEIYNQACLHWKDELQG